MSGSPYHISQTEEPNNPPISIGGSVPKSRSYRRFPCPHPKPNFAITKDSRQIGSAAKRLRDLEDALRSIGFDQPKCELTSSDCPFHHDRSELRHKISAYDRDGSPAWYMCTEKRNCPAYKRTLFSQDELSIWTDFRPEVRQLDNHLAAGVVTVVDSSHWTQQDGQMVTYTGVPVNADPKLLIATAIIRAQEQQKIQHNWLEVYGLSVSPVWAVGLKYMTKEADTNCEA